MFAELQTRADAIAYKLRTTGRIVPLLIVCLNALCGLPFRLCKRLVKAKIRTVDHQRILVIRADRIGDMVLSTPIFQALRERYPGAAITCMASSLSSQLIEKNPYIDSIIVYDPPWFDRKKGEKVFRDYLKALRLVRSHKFDMAIDLRGNIFNFFFLMFLARIPQRVSFDAALGAFFLTHAVPYRKGKHETETFFDIVRTLGARAPACPQAEIFLSEEDEECANNFFVSHGIAQDDVVIVLHPGAGNNRIYKRWPQERYCQLGKALVRKYGAKIIVTGSNAEIGIASSLTRAIGGNAILASGEISHLRLLAAVLKKCSVCIGASTGPIHVAAAVGIPVVVLCGPEDSVRWRPLGDNHVVIEKHVPCRPCRERSCPHDGKCLKLITPECVMEAVMSLLACGRNKL